MACFRDHGWQLGEHGEWCKHTSACWLPAPLPALARPRPPCLRSVLRVRFRAGSRAPNPFRQSFPSGAPRVRAGVANGAQLIDFESTLRTHTNTHGSAVYNFRVVSCTCDTILGLLQYGHDKTRPPQAHEGNRNAAVLVRARARARQDQTTSGA